MLTDTLMSLMLKLIAVAIVATRQLVDSDSWVGSLTTTHAHTSSNCPANTSTGSNGSDSESLIKVQHATPRDLVVALVRSALHGTTSGLTVQPSAQWRSPLAEHRQLAQ
jgi:hypothetical protein